MGFDMRFVDSHVVTRLVRVLGICAGALRDVTVPGPRRPAWSVGLCCAGRAGRLRENHRGWAAAVHPRSSIRRIEHDFILKSIGSWSFRGVAAGQADQRLAGLRQHRSVVYRAGQPPRQITVGEPTSLQGRLTVTYSEPGRACQHVLATDSNVVIGVAACTPSAGQQADDIVEHMTDKIHCCGRSGLPGQRWAIGSHTRPRETALEFSRYPREEALWVR
jgi:hypothetical protein